MTDFNFEQDEIFAELEHLARITVPEKAPADKFEPGKNRRATILCLDLKGFTALSEKMDSEEVRRVVDSLFKAFTHIIEAHAGYVNRYEGDAIVAVFCSAEDTGEEAVGAVACGLELQEHLSRANEILSPHELNFSMRVGIDTGEAYIGREDDARFMVRGEAFEAATSLESVCPLGRVFISASARRMAGDAFSCKDSGVFECKGSKERIQAWLVVSEDSLKEDLLNDVFADLEHLALTIVPSGKPIERLESGERRNATILFLGIGGKDAESAESHRVTQLLLSIFSKVVEKHSGYIDKLFPSGLMALFGAKKATGADAYIACACALELQTRTDEANEALAQAGIELFARIGINTGEVIVGTVGKERDTDFTAYGDAVNTAKRLETECPYGGIFIGQSAHELAGPAFEYVDVGKLSLKGKKESVQTWRVEGKSKKVTRRWERDAPVQLGHTFAGRKVELDVLNALFLEAGKRQKCERYERMAPGASKAIVVFVRGEAGIGKSRLVAEFKKRESGIVEIRGEAVRSGGLPFQVITSAICRWAYTAPLAEDSGEKVKAALEDLLFKTKDEEQKTSLAENIDRIRYLAGDSTAKDSIKDLDENSLPTALMLAFRSFLEAVAPAVLVIDDIQWAEDVSIRIVKESLTSLHSHIPLVTIVLARTEWGTPDGWSKEFEFLELELKGLSEVDAEAQIAGLLGEDANVPDHEKEWLAERAKGNPFYLEELVLAAIRAEAFAQENGIWKSRGTLETVGLPPTLDELILGHLDSLEDDLKTTLKRAAVVGQPFWRNILEAVYKALGERDELTPVLSALVEKEFVYASSDSSQAIDVPYFFHHILLKEGAYNLLLKINRKVLHRFVALTIEEIYRDDLPSFYDALSGHWEKAANPFMSVEYLSKSLITKGGNLRPDIRISECGRGLGLLERLPEGIDESIAESDIHKMRASLLLLRGDAYLTAGSMKDALCDYEKALSICREIRNNSGIANSLGNIGIAHENHGNYEKAMKFQEESLAIRREIRDKAGIAKSLDNIGNVRRLLSDYEKAMEFYTESLEIAREIGDRYVIANSLGNIGNVHYLRSDYEKSMKFYEESLAIRREIRDKAGIAASLGNIGILYESHGDYEKAMEFHKESLEIKREIGDKSGIAASLSNIGFVHENHGDYEKAMEFHKECLAIAREIDDKHTITHSLGCIGSVYENHGDYEKAMEFHKESLAIAREIGDKAGIAASLGSIGKVHGTLRDYEKAMEFYMESLSIEREIGDKLGIATSLGSIGFVHYSLGDYEKAMELYKESLSLNRAIGSKSDIARSLGNIGILHESHGDYDKAMEFYTESLAIAREIGEKSGIAASLLHIGNIHYSLRDYEKAMEFHRESLAISREIGHKESTAKNLNTMGALLIRLGIWTDALGNIKESLTIAAELGNKEDIKKNISDIRDALSDTEEKLAAHHAEPLPAGEQKALADIKTLLDETEAKLKENNTQ